MALYKYIGIAAGLYGALLANAAPANLDLISIPQETSTPTAQSIYARQDMSVVGVDYIAANTKIPLYTPAPAKRQDVLPIGVDFIPDFVPATTSIPVCARALEERQDVSVIGVNYIPSTTGIAECGAPGGPVLEARQDISVIGVHNITATTTAVEKRQAVSVIGVSTVTPTPACSLSSTDAATFELSGAVQFMDQFIKTNGETNWLSNMDMQTTAGGTQPSVLDCKPLGGGTCPIPDVQCQFFTPPEYFWIRTAAAKAHDFFTQSHEQLQNVVIIDGLNVGAVVSDFAPAKPAPKGNFLTDLLKTIAPGFSMADKISKQPEINPLPSRGRQSDFFGFIGGVLGLTAGSILLGADGSDGTQIDFDALRDKMETQVTTVFQDTNDNIVKLNSKLFGGGDDVDLSQIISLVSNINGGAGPDPNLHPITQVFASGAFLNPVDSTQIQAGIDSGFQLLKQQLAGFVLAAQNYFVFVDTTRTENDCNGITGSRFINNQCFTIEQRSVNNIQCKADSTPIDPSIVLKFDDPSAGYNIDVAAFYQNVQACANGQLATSIDLSGTFPPCAFGIPYVEAAGSACGATNSGIPDSLQINSDGCTKVVCANPTLGGGCNC